MTDYHGCVKRFDSGNNEELLFAFFQQSLKLVSYSELTLSTIIAFKRSIIHISVDNSIDESTK